MISLGEMYLKEKRIPNSKGRMKSISQKEGRGRKSTFKDILNEQNEGMVIHLLLLQGKEDQVLLHMKSVLLLLRKSSIWYLFTRSWLPVPKG